ncbi:MAG: 16S rRNA (guanine(527)-N(7))-methyltransferase RsmG [Pseudomonadota bacterium]
MTQDGRGHVLAHYAIDSQAAQKLDAYAALLAKWQRKINLVGSKTLAQLWTRHIWDSAQLGRYLPGAGSTQSSPVILDIGSGAGLPGLILAALTPAQVHSVESDTRKIAFQRQAVMAMKLSTKVVLHNKRIETLPRFQSDVITARAFASLPNILDMSVPFATENTLWILPKGENVGSELEEATKCWTFHVEQVHSETEDSARILLLSDVRRR